VQKKFEDFLLKFVEVSKWSKPISFSFFFGKERISGFQDFRVALEVHLWLIYMIGFLLKLHPLKVWYRKTGTMSSENKRVYK